MKPHKTDVKNRYKAMLLCLLLIVPSPLFSYGFGVNGYRGTGSFSFKSKPYLFPEEKASGRIDKTGFGLILDSNLASDFPYGWRLGLNVEKNELDSTDFNHGEALLCFNTDIAFTVGLVRKPFFKLWAAPEIRFGYADGDGAEFTKDTSGGVIGFGFLLGTNFHVFADFDLSLSAGVRCDIYSDSAQFPETRDLSGNAAYAYFMASLFFRSGDDRFN